MGGRKRRGLKGRTKGRTKGANIGHAEGAWVGTGGAGGCVCFEVLSREKGTDDNAEATDVPKRCSRRTRPYWRDEI